MLYRRKKNEQTRALAVVEVLELRVLYSADALGGLAPLLLEEDDEPKLELGPLNLTQLAKLSFLDSRADGESVVETRSTLDAGATSSLDYSTIENDQITQSVDSEIDSVVFIDSSVPETELLVNSIHAPSTNIIFVQSDDDGLALISQTLSQYSELASVTIISHGEHGKISLGSSQIDRNLLLDEQSSVRLWADALAEDADILLLGCDVAGNPEGKLFVDSLAMLTGADIAASTDLTGHSASNADWDLEYQTGFVQTDTLLTARALDDWAHVLAEITVDTIDDEFDIPDGTTMTDLIDLQANSGETVSLREALYAANQGAGVDTINLPSGEYALDISGTDDDSKLGDLDSTDDVVIVGLNSENTVIRQTLIGYRVLDTRAGSAEFQNVNITGGSPSGDGGAISALPGTTVTLDSSLITGNLAAGKGAGVYSEGDVVVTDSAISGNGSIGKGGGLYVEGSLSVSGSTIFNNTSSASGAGIYGNDVEVTFTEVGKNLSGSQGGGIYAASSLQLENSTVRENEADEDGGGINVVGDYTVIRTGVNDNKTHNEDGGGLYGSGTGSITDSSFVGNTAHKDGAGLYFEAHTTVTLSLFDSNTAGSDGGAIFGHAGTIDISESGFRNNTASDRGGALWNRDSISVENSSFVSNTATSMEGGAIHHISAGTLTVSNVTFTLNRANEGGAVYTKRDGDITSSTFVGNTATTKAASLWEDGGTVKVSSSLFSNNTLDDLSASGSFTTTGFNLLEAGQISTHPTDIVNGKSSLGPMTTVGYVSAYPLQADSEAINAGLASKPGDTDAQGFARDEVSDTGSSERDSEASLLYWTDSDGSINRSNTDFTNIQSIVENRPDPTDIVVDHHQDRLVWIENGGAEIVSSTLDGLGAVTSILTGLADVSSITIDSATAYLYVGFSGANSRIDKYDAAGVLQATLYDSIIANPVDMTVNQSTGRIYWAENGGGGISASIRSVDLTGGDLAIHAAASNPQSVSVNSESSFIYWGEADSDELGRLDVAQGTSLFYPTTPDLNPGSLDFDDANDQLVWSSDATDKISTLDSDLVTENSVYTHNAEIRELAVAVTSTITAKPELVQNNGLSINEGASGTINDAIVLSSDADSLPDQIRFVLTTTPSNGTLIVAGVENATEFTQAQATAGLVVYRHSGSDTLEDQIQFALKDPLHTSDQYTLKIKISPINDAPVLNPVTPATPLDEGDVHVLLVSDLGATDSDSADSMFVYRHTTTPLNGRLELNGSELAVGNTFTHAELAEGQVAYRHDGSESASENLTFIVSDGFDDSASAALQFAITAINDAPVLNPVTPPISLAEGDVHVLLVSDLGAADSDSADNTFVYRHTTTPLNGRLELNGSELTVGSTFTHAELMAGQVAYRHDNSNTTTESLIFAVSDGALDSASAALQFAITAINDAPALNPVTPPISLAEGDIHVLLASDLGATDSDSADTTFVYRHTTTPLNGRLELNGSELTVGSTFTHAELMAGQVAYRHDDSDTTTESLTFTVTDGALDSPNADLQFAITTINDAPELNPVVPSITLAEGDAHVLLVSDLGATDSDSANGSLVYSYHSALKAGQLEVNGVVLEREGSFTQEQLALGEVVYRHGGDEILKESIKFRVSDGFDKSEPVTLLLTIEPVNEFPWMTLTGNTVAENEAGAAVGDVIITDPDMDDEHIVSVSDTRFNVMNGVLALNDQERLDYEKENQVFFDLTVTDSAGASVVENIVIDVVDVNDAPEIVITPDPADGDGYQLPATVVVDSDGDAIRYSATLENGDALPEWLEFDTEDRTFHVVDPTLTVSQLEVRINADDGRGGQTFVPLLLQFDPQLSAAEPAVTEQIELPVFESVIIDRQTEVPDHEKTTAEADTPNEPGKLKTEEVLDAEEVIDSIDLHSLITPLPTFGSLELAVLDAAGSASQADSISRTITTDIDTFNLADLLKQPASDFVAASSLLSEAMDKEKNEQLERADFSQTLIGSSAGLTTGLSVGYLLWLIRGGTLMGSVLSSLPAWRFVDPLPVLSSLGGNDDDDDESLVSMVEASDQQGSPINSEPLSTTEQTSTEADSTQNPTLGSAT